MLGTIAAVTAIAGGVNSLTGGSITKMFSGGESGGSGVNSDAQKAADPFAPYRAQLGSMYSGALQPGASTDITKMPGSSQFKTGVMDPSMEATKRSMAASGQMQSGNEQIALEKIGQQGYYGFMQDYMNRLATGSGASQSPLGGATFGANVQSGQDQAAMQGLGGIMQGIGGLYGGSRSPMQYNPIQADTGSAANTAANYYGSSSSYDPSAGWSI